MTILEKYKKNSKHESQYYYTIVNGIILPYKIFKALVGKYNSIGRVSICDIESCRFESYYLPIIKRLSIKNYFKKIKGLKVNLKLLTISINQYWPTPIKIQNIVKFKTHLVSQREIRSSNIANLYYLLYNNKATRHNLIQHKTWSVGMILTLINLEKNKFLRRTTKGLKILINFLKLPTSMFLSDRFFKKSVKIFYFKNTINNIFFLKKKILKIFFLNNIHFFLINIGTNFSKIRCKKIKSIKKRLKKKLLLNFLDSL